MNNDFLAPLNAVSDGMFERKCYGEIIFHLKRILKNLCYSNPCYWKVWYKLFSNSGLKKIVQFVFWEVQNIVHENDCVAIIFLIWFSI